MPTGTLAERIEQAKETDLLPVTMQEFHEATQMSTEVGLRGPSAIVPPWTALVGHPRAIALVIER